MGFLVLGIGHPQDVPHEAFYATAAGVIPIFLILLVFQTREYRFGVAEGWRRPLYAILVGADLVFAGLAEIVAVFALFRLQDRSWERDLVFAAVTGLTVFVVIVGLKTSPHGSVRSGRSDGLRPLLRAGWKTD